MGRRITEFLTDVIEGLLKKTTTFNLEMALHDFFDKTTFYNHDSAGQPGKVPVPDKSFAVKYLLYGSFTAPGKQEILAFCSFDSTGRYAGTDRTVAVLLQEAGLAVLGYHDFYGVDTMQAERLPTASGKDQLLTLTTLTLQGGRETTVTQWDLTGGKFAAQPPLAQMHTAEFPNLSYAFYDQCRLVFTDGVPENPPTTWASEIGPVRYNYKWDPDAARFVLVPRYPPE